MSALTYDIPPTTIAHIEKVEKLKHVIDDLKGTLNVKLCELSAIRTMYLKSAIKPPHDVVKSQLAIMIQDVEDYMETEGEAYNTTFAFDSKADRVKFFSKLYEDLITSINTGVKIPDYHLARAPDVVLGILKSIEDLYV